MISVIRPRLAQRDEPREVSHAPSADRCDPARHLQLAHRREAGEAVAVTRVVQLEPTHAVTRRSAGLVEIPLRPSPGAPAGPTSSWAAAASSKPSRSISKPRRCTSAPSPSLQSSSLPGPRISRSSGSTDSAAKASASRSRYRIGKILQPAQHRQLREPGRADVRALEGRGLRRPGTRYR